MARDCSRSYPPTLTPHERNDMATATPRLMGAEVKRKEDPRLVTGTSAYVGDVTVPGLHYVVFVRSPHAHARVRKIDTKAALKRPGVVRVVTGEDLRAHVQQLPLGGPSAEGGGGAKTEAGRKHFPLSIGRVRHVGEPVAAVIATSEAAATGGVTVWASHQAPHVLRNDLATVLGVPQNLVRVIAPEVGGGFGVKFGTYPEDATLAACARLYKLPLRWTETRIEHMVATTHGRAQVTDLEAAVEADGTITAVRMHVMADIGAYPIFTFIPDLTLMMGVGVYKFTNVDLKSTCVFTNSTPVAAYRGAGRPEAAYYLERLVDVVAQELGKPPEEIRRKNFIPPSAFPYATPTGQKYDSGEYDRALGKALDLAGYQKLRAEQKDRISGGDKKLLGVGMAVYVEMCGFGPFESAVVRVEPGGGVTAFTGTSSHGQGHETTFAQIISDHLGVDFDKVVVRHGDTLNTPMGNGTGGSRSLAVGGSAIIGATLKVQEKARRIAAHMLEAAADDVVFEAGRYQVKGVPAKALTIAEIAPKAYAEGLPEGIEYGLEATDFFRPPQLVYPFGAHVAVVEIDRDTGHVSVRDFISVDDCGVRISPMLVAGQVHGGLAQGIAQALLEEMVYDADGQLVTGSLMDYAVPHAGDLPMFTTDQTVTPTPFNPMGAKGIGEAATIGSTPAIVNAVVDAPKHLGVRHLHLPLPPARVWQALKGR